MLRVVDQYCPYFSNNVLDTKNLCLQFKKRFLGFVSLLPLPRANFKALFSKFLSEIVDDVACPTVVPHNGLAQRLSG